MTEEMGYQQKLYYGIPGSAAGIQVENATDIDYDITPQKGPTTNRGTGGNVPITTENVTQLGVTITWTMNNDPSDAALTYLLAAAKTGAAVAIKLVNANDDTLFDGDCSLSKKWNAPLAGESTYDFSATPTKQESRSPTLG